MDSRPKSEVTKKLAIIKQQLTASTRLLRQRKTTIERLQRDFVKVNWPSYFFHFSLHVSWYMHLILTRSRSLTRTHWRKFVCRVKNPYWPKQINSRNLWCENAFLCHPLAASVFTMPCVCYYHKMLFIFVFIIYLYFVYFSHVIILSCHYRPSPVPHAQSNCYILSLPLLPPLLLRLRWSSIKKRWDPFSQNF